MEWLQNLVDNSATPALTAFLLGLLSALSPCPLATNIVAIGYIAKNPADRRRVFRNGLLYTAGRMTAYSLLGIILISILKEGASIFGIQKAIGKWGELLLGPVLTAVGLFMLAGRRLNLPTFRFTGNGERLVGKGGRGALLLGILFALTFCPASGIFYFGILIPMSVTATAGWILPAIFALATALPVVIVARVIAFGVEKAANCYGKMQILQKYLNSCVGTSFLIVGIYYCVITYL